jgi:hypothetical protein
MIRFCRCLTCHCQWRRVHAEADFLPLASFCGAPYGVDETCLVECMFKAGRVVSAGVQIAGEMSVDLSHIDRGTHKPTGDRGLLGCLKFDV